jgi:hypothetical protein
MISKTVKEVQYELISYNWEEKVLFFIITSLFVGLLITVVPVVIQLWDYASFLKEQLIR